MTSPQALQNLLAQRDWSEINASLSKIPQAQWCDADYMAAGFLEFYARKNPQAGIAALKKACELAPQNINHWNTLSDFYLKVQAFELAEKAIESSLALNSTHPVSLFAAAKVAVAQLDFAKAYRLANDCLKNLPTGDPLNTSVQSLMHRADPIWQEPLIGKHLRLRRLDEKSYDFFKQARQNKAFQHHYNFFKTDSDEQIMQDLRNAKRSPVDSKKIEWAIEKSGRLIGLAGLVDFDFRNRRAEIQIGFPFEKGKADALEATLLVLEFAFKKLRLNKVVSYVYSDNPKGQHNTLRLGFAQEGMLRSHVNDAQNQTWLDLYINAMQKTEYLKNKRLQHIAKRLFGRDIIQCY